MINVGGRVNGLRIVGNRIEDFGDADSALDHMLYLSEVPRHDASIRNIVVEWNDIASYNNAGALLVHSWNNIAGFAAKDVVIRYNTVRGTGTWGLVVAPFWQGGPANWKVYQNDIRISASRGVVHFFSHGGGNTANGADASFQLFHNTLVNRRATQGVPPDKLGPVILRSQVNVGRQEHAPTVELNLVSTEGRPAGVPGNAGAGFEPDRAARPGTRVPSSLSIAAHPRAVRFLDKGRVASSDSLSMKVKSVGRASQFVRLCSDVRLRAAGPSSSNRTMRPI